MTTEAPKRPTPPPPPGKPPMQGATQANTIARKVFTESSGMKNDPQRVVIYGPGGVGKSSLAKSLEEVGIRPKFVDIGHSTGRLDVRRIDNIDTWEELRGVLNTPELFAGYNAVVIDDMTTAEEMAANWVVRNIKHEKGKPINGIEDYGWGKGLGHTYDEFLKIFGDLDQMIRAGIHVICIAHDCTERVPNPAGEDWIQYQPRLQNPKSGKDSIRLRMKEWCDHLLFIGYDTAVTEDGKGKGIGTRTIYSTEMPSWMAKSRTLADPVPYEKGGCEIWKLLLKGESV